VCTPPAGWKSVLLGAVTASQYGLSRPASADGDVPIIGMQHIDNGTVKGTPQQRVQVTEAELERFSVRPGDVLLNRTNSLDQVGKSALVPSGLGTCVFASYLVRLLVDEKHAHSAFLARVLSSAKSVAVLRHMATPGVSQYNINPSFLLRHYRVLLPPLFEQVAIARAIDVWDKCVAGLRQLLNAKRRFKSGLMKELLTGKRRLKESEGSQWHQRYLGDLFTERCEPKRNDLPLLSITADRGVINRDDLDRRDSSAADKSKYLRIAPGDIGYNTMRMWQGVSALSALEGIVSPAYTVCVPGEDIDGRFAAQLFKLPRVVDLFRRHSQGLVDDTLSLKFPRFAEIRVTIPSIQEQRLIALTLEHVDQEINLLERLHVLLDQQRGGVSELLLSGKVRVPA
jgi:type I restriction enzyme S subunit